MDKRPLQFFYDACGLDAPGDPTPAVGGVCTDSRTIVPGDLYLAIRGPHFDGHAFVGEAFRKGAVAAVVRNDFEIADKTQQERLLRVKEPRLALGQIAKSYRQSIETPVFAIAGSNGKTTTKDLTASVLSQQLKAAWSPDSYNNDIGVPLTLLGVNSSHEVALVEVGTNHPGEMNYLLDLVHPGHGILTSIGREHLEFFRDIEGVLDEEATLARFIGSGGILFVNGDSYGIETLSAACKGIVQTVGFGQNNHFRISQCRIHLDHTEFTLDADDFPDLSGAYVAPMPGRAQAVNASLAIAVGGSMGLNKESIQKGLSACPQPKWRMAFREVSGIRILEDYYNANTDSMAEALATLKELGRGRRKIAVLGGMAELGATGAAMHYEVGKTAAAHEIDMVFAVGEHASSVVLGAKENGLTRAKALEGMEDLVREVRDSIGETDILLVKGSRSARMERFIHGFLDYYEKELNPT